VSCSEIYWQFLTFTARIKSTIGREPAEVLRLKSVRRAASLGLKFWWVRLWDTHTLVDHVSAGRNGAKAPVRDKWVPSETPGHVLGQESRKRPEPSGWCSKQDTRKFAFVGHWGNQGWGVFIPHPPRRGRSDQDLHSSPPHWECGRSCQVARRGLAPSPGTNLGIRRRGRESYARSTRLPLAAAAIVGNPTVRRTPRRRCRIYTTLQIQLSCSADSCEILRKPPSGRIYRVAKK